MAVNGLFEEFLGRPADTAGSNTFLAALTQGATIPQVTVVIMASAEFSPVDPAPATVDPAVLPANDVLTLLARASAATPSNDGIIAIVDRGGNILGVSVENGVSPILTGNSANLTFAIDGAVALARTGAFFANNTAPLTSITVQFLSQTTITQRMTDSSPDVTDHEFAALWARRRGSDSNWRPLPARRAQHAVCRSFRHRVYQPRQFGETGPGGTTPITIPERFNVDPAYIPASIPSDEDLQAPDSYGIVSGIDPTAQGRGIGTLPGGLPIYLNGTLVGGIGVFYPGTTGYASAENSALSSNFNPALPDRSEEAEYA